MSKIGIMGALLAVFVAIIVGTSLIGPVTSEIRTDSEVTEVANESFSIVSARQAGGDLNPAVPFNVTNNYATGNWRATSTRPSECDIDSNFILYNQSGSVILAANYTINATGVMTFVDTAGINQTAGTAAYINSTTRSYTYCTDEYLATQWNRTIIRLVPGFFALGIFGISLAIFFIIRRKWMD